MATAIQYHGPIRIEVDSEAVGGLYYAKAYRGSNPAPLVEVSDATRETAITNCAAGLATTVEGDYSLNPRQIVPPNKPHII